MALVTVRAVIHVSVHTLMILVGLILVRVLMTTQTGEDQVVRRIRVARVAGTGAAMVLREVGVVEHRSQPARRAVAGLAGRRETRRRVSGIRRPVVIRLVAAHTGCVGDVVVAIDVALRACHRRSVEARQWPARRGVIKLACGPDDGVMARLTSRGEARRNMVDRSLGVVVVRLVTRHTGRTRQVVIVIHVALRTWCRCVGSC